MHKTSSLNMIVKDKKGFCVHGTIEYVTMIGRYSSFELPTNCLTRVVKKGFPLKEIETLTFYRGCHAN